MLITTVTGTSMPLLWQPSTAHPAVLLQYNCPVKTSMFFLKLRSMLMHWYLWYNTMCLCTLMSHETHIKANSSQSMNPPTGLRWISRTWLKWFTSALLWNTEFFFNPSSSSLPLTPTHSSHRLFRLLFLTLPGRADAVAVASGWALYRF